MVGRSTVIGVAASLGIELLIAAGAGAQTVPARFVTVDQGADELKADEALARGLGTQLLGRPDQLSYEAVINALLDDTRRDTPQAARTGGVVARVTPYAFVVAEMRGAKVELLSTCVSRSTGKTVTNAFIVVPQASFPGPTPPTLEHVLARLKTLSDADRPARFVYHNKYSTSSYFLPSLLFRARRVFGHDRTSNPAGVTMIAVERNDSPSSSDLIRAVAEQAGDRETIASVWNGPRAGFADAAGKYYADGQQVLRGRAEGSLRPASRRPAVRPARGHQKGRR
jgi:hypothetical protein